MMEDYEFRDLNTKSRFLGDAFKLSVRDGYDSKKFVQAIMTRREFVPLLTMLQGQEWCDEHFLYYHLIRNYTPFIKGETVDEYSMWFMGFTYKYWMQSRKKNPREVYEILPFDTFYQMMPFYHTQDWDFVINDALNEHAYAKSHHNIFKYILKEKTGGG